ncbi:hypothetical protein Trydic_g3991 [Trypoxylus dichotomus]
MDSVLTAEDVASLTIFRCSLCCRRLHIPIMHDKLHSNVCGSCYRKSPSTDVTENIELDLLMAKLRFPCNYKLERCTLYGQFYKTCEHEERCPFKQRSCPFAYINKCESETSYNLSDMIVHVHRQHRNDTLPVYIHGIENNPLEETLKLRIKNPSEEIPDLLYFISLYDKYVLLKTTWKSNACMVYTFFHLVGHGSRTINWIFSGFSSPPKEDLEMLEVDLFQCYGSETFTTHLNLLKNLNSEKEIKVYIRFAQLPPPDDTSLFRRGSVWWQCKLCNGIVNKVDCCSRYLKPIKCILCKATKCQECNEAPCSTELIDFSTWGLDSVFSCKICTLLIRGDKYDIHRKYQCDTLHSECPFCQKKITFSKMIAHLMDSHSAYVNSEYCMASVGSERTLVFTNHTNIFIRKYILSTDGRFSVQTIKMSSPYWDSCYLWKIDIKRKGSALILCIRDLIAILVLGAKQ